MNIGSMLTLGIALSMDAMSVSVSHGMAAAGLRKRDVFKTGLFFGFFQALMPVIGHAAGSRVAQYIEKLGPWVAFAFLLVLGVQMIRNALKPSSAQPGSVTNSTGVLLMMAVATSIDALAVGVSLAFAGANIFLCAAVIGLVTFILSVFGGFMGGKLGEKFQKQAGVTGGFMLIIIGLTILI